MVEPAITAGVSAKPGRAASPLRLCALSRAERPVDDLIRFVLGPDGAIGPDITGKLGGRGVWVTATRDAVTEAARRNVFAKSLKLNAKPVVDLAELVERLLLERVRQALSFTNKAGLLTAGFTKVEKALEAGQVFVLIAAADGADDGSARLERKFIAISAAQGRAAMLTRSLRIADLSLAIGRPNVVHAALAHGGQSRAFLKECRRLERYQRNETTGGNTGPDCTPHSDASYSDALAEATSGLNTDQV